MKKKMSGACVSFDLFLYVLICTNCCPGIMQIIIFHYLDIYTYVLTKLLMMKNELIKMIKYDKRQTFIVWIYQYIFSQIWLIWIITNYKYVLLVQVNWSDRAFKTDESFLQGELYFLYNREPIDWPYK